MKFLIETVKGKIVHDFTFSLIQAIEYKNWWKPESCSYKLSKPNASYFDSVSTPVGSVEFVTQHMEAMYGIKYKPINIPKELRQEEFLKRHVVVKYSTEITETNVFVKSMDKIKSFTEIINTKRDLATIPEGTYMVSELIDIKSEWRAFIYKGELVGLQNYSGDFWIFPNVPQIRDMIKAYTQAPIAYTLDVAITKDGCTVVVEVHDFFSCGLYGFNDSRIYPNMLHDWYKEYVKKYEAIH